MYCIGLHLCNSFDVITHHMFMFRSILDNTMYLSLCEFNKLIIDYISIVQQVIVFAQSWLLISTEINNPSKTKAIKENWHNGLTCICSLILYFNFLGFCRHNHVISRSLVTSYTQLPFCFYLSHKQKTNWHFSNNGRTL